MSRLTPAQRPIRERLLRDRRRAKLTVAAALAALAVLIATLVLVIQGDSPTAATQRPAVQAEQQGSDAARRITEMYNNRFGHAPAPGVAVRPQTGTPDEDGTK
jgi:hypothetical protein